MTQGYNADDSGEPIKSVRVVGSRLVDFTSANGAIGSNFNLNPVIPAGMWKLVAVKFQFQTSSTAATRTVGISWGWSNNLYASVSQIASLTYNYIVGVGMSNSAALLPNNTLIIGVPPEILLGVGSVLGLQDGFGLFADNHDTNGATGDQFKNVTYRMQEM